MTADLSHNPRVLAGPDESTLPAEIARLTGERAAAGAWFLKLDALNTRQAAELRRTADAAGAEVWTKPLGDGGHDAILGLPAPGVERFLRALEGGLAHPLASIVRASLAAWRRVGFRLRCGGRTLELGPRTLVMGIVNVTPDSFSDGGQFLAATAAIDQGRRLADEGADLIDVGGESTRPGAQSVDADEECRRVLPVVEALAAETDALISIDTSKAGVARRALAAGASILNDVTALRGDPAMAALAAESGAPLVLMHMQGTPRTMQQAPHYGDLMGELVGFLRQRMAVAVAAGVREEQIIADPGIGFGKTLAHNLEVLRRLPELRSLGRPILLGTSRKSLIGAVLRVPVAERVLGTAATVAYGIARGAHVVRVHDVAAMRQVARMTDAMTGRC